MTAPAARQPAVGGGVAPAPDAAARPARGREPATSAGGCRTSPSTRPDTSSSARAGPRRTRASTDDRPPSSGRPSTRLCPTSRATWGSHCRRTRDVGRSRVGVVDVGRALGLRLQPRAAASGPSTRGRRREAAARRDAGRARRGAPPPGRRRPSGCRRALRRRGDLDVSSPRDARAACCPRRGSPLPAGERSMWRSSSERDVPAREGRARAARRRGELLEGLRLFDVFRGPQGRRGQALAGLRLRCGRRTGR
jgi:hypothetical protein